MGSSGIILTSSSLKSKIMKDIFLYIQLGVFVMNVIVFIYLMQSEKYNYKFARITLLFILTVGLIVNIGKVTFLTILFTSSTFISLINFNFKPNGKVIRFIQRLRGDRNGSNERLQGMQGHSQGHNKALSKQKA